VTARQGTPRVSVVIPAYNEGDEIVPVLDRLFESVTLDCEVLVVVDFTEDTTVPVVEKYAVTEPRLRPVVQTYGRGPANAIRYGIDAAASPVVVVTMADGCDDPRQIDDLTRLVERGVVVAAASRYMPGGQQVGGPLVKGLLSRLAGRSLQWFARVGTRDPTNSYKAYRPSGSTARPGCRTSSWPGGCRSTSAGTASPTVHSSTSPPCVSGCRPAPDRTVAQIGVSTA
jgi:dolichol-phosphate mannosyltransferase